MSEKVGFIGLGNMGRPMAQRLLAAGYELTVYNRDERKADELVQLGARRVQRPADVLEPGGIVITMVAHDKALEEITLEQDVLVRLGEGGVHLSMSTIAPVTASKLAELHAGMGSTYLASPVFGRPDAAAAGELRICIAGPAAAKERVRPLLQVMGQGIFDFGEEAQAANVVKISGNFLIAAAMEAMSEVFTLGEKNGVARTAIYDLFSQTLFACPIYQNYGKMLAEHRYLHTPAGFQMDLGLKDINLVLQTAAASAVPMPLGSLLHDRLLTGVAKGRATLDWSGLALAVDEDAGLDPRQEEKS